MLILGHTVSGPGGGLLPPAVSVGGPAAFGMSGPPGNLTPSKVDYADWGSGGGVATSVPPVGSGTKSWNH